MEKINEEKVEKKHFPFFKVLIGIIAIIAIALIAFGLERAIGNTIRDVNIKKDKLSGTNITYTSVKPLDTRIMAIIASDGSVRLAFEECLSCYYNYGVKSTFTDTGTSVICDNCHCETPYDNIGILMEECTPYPILNEYYIEDDHTIMIPKDFLEHCSEILALYRKGPGNYTPIYGDEDYTNMAITEGGDRALQYDMDGGVRAPGHTNPYEELEYRNEQISGIYNIYKEDVNMYASQEDRNTFEALFKELQELSDSIEPDMSDDEVEEINVLFDEIEAGLSAIAGRLSE